MLIALFLNVAGIIYNVNQANTFEKQAVQIMQKDGGLTEDAMYKINNKKNGLRKQYWYMFDVQPNNPDTKKPSDETVESDTSAYFVPKTDSHGMATDVFEDIDHPNQLFKKDDDIDKSTIYAPAPTPQDTVRYKRELSDSDYQTYMSIIKNEDYNEALKFLRSKGIDADDNTFYTVKEGESVVPKQDITIPVYVAYNSAVDNQGNTGHKLNYQRVYLYGTQEVVNINGKIKTTDGDDVKNDKGKELIVKDVKGEELIVNDGKESVLQPKNETYSVISTYNGKPIMINNNLLLTNTEIHPYGNKNKIHYWVNKEIHPYGTKIHYWIIIHIPFIAFSKANSGAAINHSYMGETVSQYGRQANQ